jgi:predicted glycosyltransferase involved in capsule biosynthesis
MNVIEDSTKLSIVVPLRALDFTFYRERLVLRDSLALMEVETILVDDGSPSEVAAQISFFCEQRGYTHVRLNSGDRAFSLSRARNAGLKKAKGVFVYFDDADLVYTKVFFQAVLNQLRLLAHSPFNFISVPAVYLTVSASNQVLFDGSLDNSYSRVVQALLLEDPKGGPTNDIVASYAPASGVVAVRRDLALQIGGYDEDFIGWGGEDRDFIFRLLALNEQLPLPDKFQQTESWDLNDTCVFQGWRALHRLHGEFMARQGLYAVHLHHEKLDWRKPLSSANNIKRAANKALHTSVADRFADQVFDLQSSLLFDTYRASQLLDHKGLSRNLMERVREVNRVKERSLELRRSSLQKFRKLLISPVAFLADSRFALLRAAVRLFR